MKCQYASVTDEFHGWECMITGGECALLFPNEKLCLALIEDAEPTGAAYPRGKNEPERHRSGSEEWRIE